MNAYIFVIVLFCAVNQLATIVDENDEFFDACLNLNYNCLGSKRNVTSSCLASNISNFIGDYKDFFHPSKFRLQYWNQQIIETKRVKTYVHGWLEIIDAIATHEVLKTQLKLNIHGHVAEIGTHHGKYLIWITAHLREGEKAIALDLFEKMQSQNIDGSGKGDLQKLTSNFRIYFGDLYLMKTLVAVPINSLQIPLCFFYDHGFNKDVRFFSVDGGHLVDNAYEDTWTAFSTLTNGGVIAIDDIAHGLHVFEGALKFLYSNSQIKPFLMTQNKLFLCYKYYYPSYYKAMDNIRLGRITKSYTTMAGAKLIIFQPLVPLMLHGWMFPSHSNEVFNCNQLKSNNISFGFLPQYEIT